MEIEETYKISLKAVNTGEVFTDQLLEILIENCCKSLAKQTDLKDLPALPDADLVLVKQLHASLLHIYTQAVRQNTSLEDFSNFLINECSISKARAGLLSGYYCKWFPLIRVQLLNIGNHLPHITDVKWKVDHIIKTSSLDVSGGPLFRIALKTEKYDPNAHEPKVEVIHFTCTHQELQDLVYKLKDAANHCHKIAAGFLSQ